MAFTKGIILLIIALITVVLPRVCGQLDFENLTVAVNPQDWYYAHGVDHVDYDEEEDIPCKLRPTDPHMYDRITTILARQAKLIQINLDIANHTDNPLLQDTKWIYQGNVWARVAHSHGITILSLAFNFGILSLMTLSFGVNALQVELAEEPFGCLVNMTETARMRPVLDILLRDFKPDGPLSVTIGEGVCHQIIKNINGYAKFTDQCCFRMPGSGKIDCPADLPNIWLTVLNTLLAICGIAVFLFGPLIATTWLYAHTLDTIKYIVKLKEPLYKTMSICHGAFNPRIGANSVIDLRNKEFLKCKQILKELPSDTVLPIKIDEFNILVSYNKLLPENQVPVGLFQSLSRAVFLCRLQDLPPFQDCCEANILGCIRESNPLQWITVCRLIGRIFLVFFALVPFYIRLALYFLFEDPEIQVRRSAAEKVGLPMWFDYKVLQYLTPTHPLYFVIYLLYFGSGITLACLSASNKSSRFQQVIIDSMKDLFNLSWLDALGMVTKNFIWPFKKFGIWGLLAGIVYWPVVMPVSLLACLFYCFPLIYLSGRILYHSLELSGKEEFQAEDVTLPGEMRNDMHKFETDQLLNHLASTGSRRSGPGWCRRLISNIHPKKLLLNMTLAFVCIGTLISIMMVFAECVSFVLHVCVFTLMGIIINAGKVLKYGTLIFLVVIYSYDCYNNVYMKYLKLNKSLFSEIKGRIKDLDSVTSLPSHLQENRGFKAAEASEQGEHESEDDVSKELINNLNINDLILFIDNDDTPRIPRRLFEMVCTIEVAGSPGPVYRSLLYATGKFLVIVFFLLFVFIVVLSFGDVYKVSNTNQMLATMAGGFMPFIFGSFLKPAAPDIELGTVSFKSKLQEIVINFWQPWPMYDFPFDVEEKPEEEEEGSEDSKSRSGPSRSGSTASLTKSEESEEKPKLEDMELHERLKYLKSVRSAEGQLVDICVIIPDQGEHIMEHSSLGNLNDLKQEQVYTDSIV